MKAKKHRIIRELTVVAFLITLAACAHVCFAQDSSKNIGGFSPPPELKRFEPFLGSYSAAVDWPSRNLRWEGSLELAYAVKGWYIESNLIKETASPHRQWRMMIAWDMNERVSARSNLSIRSTQTFSLCHNARPTW